MTSPHANPETWDTIASDYAKDITPHAAKYAAEALRLAPVDPSAHVLDLAAGPGTLAFLAAPRVARVTAVDFAPAMVHQLRTKADREGIRNIDAHVMDAQAPNLPDATFHAAYCLFAFMFFSDRAKAFRELLRVLRPGGKAVVATWAPIDKRPLMKLGFDAMREAVPEVSPPQKGDLQDDASCIAEMTAGGFRDVSVHAFTASMPVSSPEHYLDVMERSGAPLAMLRKKFGDAWAERRACLLEVLGRSIPAGGTDLSAEALLTVGSRPA